MPIRRWIRPLVVRWALFQLDCIIYLQAFVASVTRWVFYRAVNAVHWIALWFGGIEAIQRMQEIQYEALVTSSMVAATKLDRLTHKLEDNQKVQMVEGITMADIPKYGSMKN